MLRYPLYQPICLIFNPSKSHRLETSSAHSKAQNMFPDLRKILLLSVFLTGIPACERRCDCCPIEGPVYFQALITDYQVAGLQKQISPSHWASYRNGDTIYAAGDLKIQLAAVVEQIALLRAAPKQNGLFMTSAYACSPIYLPRSDQRLLALSITSDADYDAAHPAGSDLKDLFESDAPGPSSPTPKISLRQYLDEESDHFLLHEPVLYFRQNPAQPSRHRLQFELQLSDTSFSFQTPPFILG